MNVEEFWTRRTDALTRQLRRWVQNHDSDLPPVIASALGYELAALIARNADDLASADAIIEAWARVMKDQVRAFGIGKEHP